MKHMRILRGLLIGGLLPVSCWALSRIEVAEPQDVSLTIYDTGTALVRERRRISVMEGENILHFQQLPAKLQPLSVSFSPPPHVTGITPVDQQFVYDLADADALVRAYVGRTINIVTADKTLTGKLLSGAGVIKQSDADAPFILEQEDGKLLLVSRSDIQSIIFPDADQVYTWPTFIWRVEAREETMQNMRMNYSVQGMAWNAAYEVVLSDDQEEARFSGRFMLSNHSGGDFEEVQLRLVATEKGLASAGNWKGIDVVRDARKTPASLRYVYGNENLTFSEWIGNLAPLFTYQLPSKMSLRNGVSKYVEFLTAEHVKVTRFFVFDGVKFDRFQRNRRNDWNYGTETHHVVESYLDFVNSSDNSLGMDLPPGLFRLYQQQTDGTIDWVGEDAIGVISVADKGEVRLGPARGLWGERERTGYGEIIPLHEYEESFEIRLENDSPHDVTIRVVEHLYRWNDFEIIRADTPYTQTGAQTIEFQPRLKSGGKRSVHYTVRYRW